MQYDQMGHQYDDTRRPDPRLADLFYTELKPNLDGVILDIACGTGNYTKLLAERGLSLEGLDRSTTMLSVAREKAPELNWHLGNVEALPFEDGIFAGALCVNAIHHFPHLLKPFSEVSRVMRGGKFVLFTSTPESLNGFWLKHYFPKAIQASCDQIPPTKKIRETLCGAGFATVEQHAYFVPEDPVDLFLYAGKHNPSLYLDERVRARISTFTDIAPPSEVKEGIERLAADIASGEIDRVCRANSGSDGDYMVFVASK